MINNDGKGIASGYSREYNSYEEEFWIYIAETFGVNNDNKTIKVTGSNKYSLYENFFEVWIVYDSSTKPSRIPIYYYYKDEHRSKAVSEKFIVYVPAYDNHVAIVADRTGKIHRLLDFPDDIDNVDSKFAFNEDTDIITIAKDGNVRRFNCNTVPEQLFKKLYETYDDYNYYRQDGLEWEVRELMKDLISKAKGEELK